MLKTLDQGGGGGGGGGGEGGGGIILSTSAHYSFISFAYYFGVFADHKNSLRPRFSETNFPMVRYFPPLV